VLSQRSENLSLPIGDARVNPCMRLGHGPILRGTPAVGARSAARSVADPWRNP
jgi:hypothetical protein